MHLHIRIRKKLNLPYSFMVIFFSIDIPKKSLEKCVGIFKSLVTFAALIEERFDCLQPLKKMPKTTAQLFRFVVMFLPHARQISLIAF